MAATRPVIGAYRLEAPLARGGLSEVWLARGADGARVALKRPLDALNTAAVEALERERDVGRRLHHPAIVSVLDAGSDADGPYVVFEYIDGPSLRERLGQGPLAEPECVSMGTAILEALSVAHSHGIVHNDLKPENILLGPRGPKLTDFGAAQTFTETVTAERARELAATIAYLAPEVLAGADPSPASDLYSLGLTLYESVAGRLPFAGSATVSAGQRMAVEAPRLRRFAPAATPHLERTLARALNPDPGLRYPDAAAFAAQLSLKHEPTVVIPRPAQATPVSPPAPRRVSNAGQKGGRAGLVVAGFSALLMLGTAAALAGGRDDGDGDAAGGPIFDAQARLALNVPEPTVAAPAPARPTADAPAPATAEAGGGGATDSRGTPDRRDDQPKERGKPEEKANDKSDEKKQEKEDDDD